MRSPFIFLLVILAIAGCSSASFILPEQVTPTPTPTSYSIGGTITGLSGTVILQNNAGDNLTLTADGSFTFTTAIAEGSTYTVTVLTNPSIQTCTASNNAGTVTNANITSVSVVCSTNSHTVGGTISGLSGTIVLQNNATDNLTLTADGSFTFATNVAEASAYAVTVLTQPVGQVCSVASGTGTMGTANVTNVALSCVAALGATTLIDVTPIIQTGVFSSYNSQQDQFLLTWWNGDEANIDFIIYNSDGSIEVPYTILFNGTITPLSDVVSCYNSHSDQYFVVWNEFNTSSAAFAILDSSGNVVQGVTTITGTHAPNDTIACSYNSTTHQYFVSWADVAQAMFFAIINENGTEYKAETSIPNAIGITTHGYRVFSSYNSTTNEYLISWVGSNFTVYFAIYDATGTAVKTATAISASNGYSNAANCYNSTNNQFFITWYDSSGVYFSIYNASGTAVTSPQTITGFINEIVYGPVYCSYNSTQNNYFLTGTSASTQNTQYTILSDQGAIVVTPATISNPTGLVTRRTVYSSFGTTSDKVLISWMADDAASIFKGYFAFYSYSP